VVLDGLRDKLRPTAAADEGRDAVFGHQVTQEWQSRRWR
jgi:hypothetical protein